MPPTDRPLPRFIAEPPHELEPYGRWGDRLAEAFLAACAAVDEAPEGAQPGEIEWYPERSYGGRTYVPATAHRRRGPRVLRVRLVHPARRKTRAPADATDFRAVADFTDETADQNPHWEIDLSDEVIGRWRGPREARGDVTLVWGVPLGAGMAGAAAVTGGARRGDRRPVRARSGPPFHARRARRRRAASARTSLYLEVKLWGKRSEPLAVESLYEAE